MNVSQMKELQRMHELKSLVDIDFKVSVLPSKNIFEQIYVYGRGRLLFFNLEIPSPDLDKYSDIEISITRASCKSYLYLWYENSKEKSATVESFDSTEQAFDAALVILVDHCSSEDIRKYVKFNIDL